MSRHWSPSDPCVKCGEVHGLAGCPDDLCQCTGCVDCDAPEFGGRCEQEQQWGSNLCRLCKRGEE